MKLRVLLPLLVLAFAATGPLAAQSSPATAAVPTRIAVIDVQRVMGDTNAGKAASAKLVKLQEERIAQAKQMDEEIRKLDNEATAGRATYSESKLAELQRQIADKRVAMQQFAQRAEQEIGALRDREIQALEAKVKPIIDALGAEMNLAAIFNKFESGLIFASDRIDLTDEVIRRFNAAK